MGKKQKTGQKNSVKSLSLRQKLFIAEFLKSMDSQSAAIKAGYSKTRAKRSAEELLSNPKIMAEINRRIKRQAGSLKVEKSYVIKKLLDIVEFSLSEEEIYDKEGNFTGKTKLKDTSAGLKALEYLSKHLGLAASDKKTVDAEEKSRAFIENINIKKI